MKILLFSRATIAHTASDVEKLLSLVEQYGFDYAVNSEMASLIESLTQRRVEPERIYEKLDAELCHEAVMVSCGGDGTLLEAVHRLGKQTIPVAGINFGHLGFLTSATRDNVETFFADLAEGKYSIQRRTMLSIEGVEPEPLTALNEVAVQRLEASMLKVRARVNSQTVARYNGDGLIVATPTGSTAYSLSAGGPIVAPDCGCFMLTPLAPHNFGMRSVVVPDTATIELEIDARWAGRALLSVDNRTLELGAEQRLTVRRSEQEILLVVPHNISFYETLHSKMMWDVDVRN